MITFAIIFFVSCPPNPKIKRIDIYNNIRIKKRLERSRTATHAVGIKVDWGKVRLSLTYTGPKQRLGGMKKD